jgi:hypothetical protein
MDPVADFCLRLEREAMVLLPDETFALSDEERGLTQRNLGDGRAKNISRDPLSGRLTGAGVEGEANERLAALLERYGAWTADLLARRFGRWAGRLEIGRTSYRSRALDQKPASPRKDDRRLHLDAFASQPVGGRRILRVFCNIDVAGAAREWSLGEPFEVVARRFAGRARRLLPGEAAALRTLRITRGLRTPYDQLMLQLHDLAKLDEVYQTSSPQRSVSFAPGAAWVVFTDQVAHAARKGRLLLEQTWYLPVEAMIEPAASPLRVLERMTGETLV